LVFTIPIPKDISVGTFRYHFFDGNPFFPQKGGTGPLFEKKGGTGPLFDTASPPFAEKRSSHQISNTDQKYQPPSKSDTSKIPIPKKLLVTPWYTTLEKYKISATHRVIRTKQNNVTAESMNCKNSDVPRN
jgi:hypothetical protein